jgi:hypothetical protein
MTLTGTSAFALVGGASTATGSFSGNDPAHQDADGVYDCASSCVPGKYSAWVSPVTQVIDDEPRQDCFLVAVTPKAIRLSGSMTAIPWDQDWICAVISEGALGLDDRRRLLG